MMPEYISCVIPDCSEILYRQILLMSKVVRCMGNGFSHVGDISEMMRIILEPDHVNIGSSV